MSKNRAMDIDHPPAARVALAHDYLTQRGGAERVALVMSHAFPGAPLYTSLYAPEQTFPAFSHIQVRTSMLQGIPAFRRDPRLALPLLGPAWDHMPAPDADVVLASSSGWAHGINVNPGTPILVYCHNPARWLYQVNEYDSWRMRRAASAPLRHLLRRWDQSAARRAHRYLANSNVVARRIRDVYGIDAEVLHPPVSVDVTGAQEQVPGLDAGFWLTISRGRGYKNVSAIVEAVSRMPGEQLVVVGSPPPDVPVVANVRWLGVITDAQLRWLYSRARALVSVSREDFGLTPIEANAFGTPVAVLRAGGFLDSTDEGRSGVFIEEATAESVAATLRKFPDFDSSTVRANVTRFDARRFANRLQEVVAAAVQ